MARDEPSQLPSAVDDAQVVALEVYGAHRSRARVPVSTPGFGQQGLVATLGVLEPPSLLFGIHSTRRLERRGEGNPPQADRGLDGGEVAFDQPDQRAKPGIGPRDVLMEQGGVGAVATFGRILGLDPRGEAGDAQVDGVASAGQVEHDLEEPLGFFFPAQTAIALPPWRRAAVALPPWRRAVIAWPPAPRVTG